jgi:deoxyribodipyrimidine photolyase-like uncharacterized protein
VAELRCLVPVLGDQLDLDAAAFDGFDARLDAVWMAEVAEESTHVVSGQARIALFLSAMRHFALALQAAGRALQYTPLVAPGNPWLYHAQLSAALNLKLLNPREVVAAAVAAHVAGLAPLASVEGFVRQILGWREYGRGNYWTQMPGYPQRNALAAHADLPGWYWTGATDMACLRDAIGQTLAHGYANHIQRMSPHCQGCRYDPAQRTGSSACPFTTLYWDFLMRHQAALARNARMALQVKNLARVDATQRQQVIERAAAIRCGAVGAAGAAGALGAGTSGVIRIHPRGPQPRRASRRFNRAPASAHATPSTARCESFSPWWPRVSRGLRLANELLANNEVPAW